eukprot:scaffold4364_cov119-Isochrysis_galbana.AAC.17
MVTSSSPKPSNHPATSHFTPPLPLLSQSSRLLIQGPSFAGGRVHGCVHYDIQGVVHWKISSIQVLDALAAHENEKGHSTYMTLTYF